MLKEKGNNIFIKHKIIDTDESMILYYGLKILALKILHLGIFIIIGLMFDTVILSIALYSLLFILRSYTGGYHAKNPISCLVYSCFISMIFNIYCLIITPSIIYLLLTTWLCCYIQVETPIIYDDNPLSKNEIKIFKNKISIILALAIFCLGIGTLLDNASLIALGSYPIYIDFVLIKIHKSK